MEVTEQNASPIEKGLFVEEVSDKQSDIPAPKRQTRSRGKRDIVDLKPEKETKPKRGGKKSAAKGKKSAKIEVAEEENEEMA